MQYESIHLENKNKLNRDYRSQQENIKQFFEYSPFDDYKIRLNDIKRQFYKRESLTKVLTRMNESWDAPHETLREIDRLRHPDSVVVIGGQQAGLLTGPSYTMNKIISIVTLARKQEKALGIPVIPVFWIAGEDHDFAEVNHTFSVQNKQMHKHTIRQEQVIKKSISDMRLDQEKAEIWLREFLNDLMETTYTKEWYEKAIRCLQASFSYVDFCARLIFEMFPDAGLVLVDSHHPDLRQLESDYFVQMIEQERGLNLAVFRSIERLHQLGFEVPLEFERDDANLFYHDENGERILLKREQEKWIGKQDEVHFSTKELLDLAKTNPERLSNNVITRPLMQEMVFPTLAFIAGDGEISYWAAFMEAFRTLGVTMPPVVPRLSMSFITGRALKLLEEHVLDADEVVHQGLDHVKINWLKGQTTVPLDLMFEEAKQSIAQIHMPIREYAKEVSADLYAEARKNLVYMERQLDYLQQKTNKKLQEQYGTVLGQFDEIQFALHPNRSLQERVWNPFSFINHYGFAFIEEIIEGDLSFEADHYLIYLER
jgi:bacillithiol biosynthesis cysteine-adding enzyme BshC